MLDELDALGALGLPDGIIIGMASAVNSTEVARKNKVSFMIVVVVVVRCVQHGEEEFGAQLKRSMRRKTSGLKYPSPDMINMAC